jgi:polyisoprenoid-binding protein YceI
MWNRPTLAAAAVVILAAAALVGTAGARPAAATWSGDTVHSHVLFKVKHLGVSSAHGRFNDFTVSVQAGDGGADLSAVSFTVKADSVDTGAPKRDQHLRSPDFLNAKQFAEISFKSTAVEALDKDAFEVAGNLTLHGVTKPLTVKVVRVGSGKGMKGEDLAGYESTFTIKRSDFGMTNMVGPVGDEIEATVAVEAARQ